MVFIVIFPDFNTKSSVYCFTNGKIPSVFFNKFNLTLRTTVGNTVNLPLHTLKLTFHITTITTTTEYIMRIIYITSKNTLLLCE